MNQPTKEMVTRQNQPVVEWLKQDGSQKWSNHLITGPLYSYETGI
jgi:hypothetical protein